MHTRVIKSLFIPFTDTAFISSVPWCRWLVAGLSLRESVFYSRPACVGFVRSKLALENVSLQVPRFSPSSTIPPVLHTHILFSTPDAV